MNESIFFRALDQLMQPPPGLDSISTYHTIEEYPRIALNTFNDLIDMYDGDAPETFSEALLAAINWARVRFPLVIIPHEDRYCMKVHARARGMSRPLFFKSRAVAEYAAKELVSFGTGKSFVQGAPSLDIGKEIGPTDAGVITMRGVLQ